MGWVLRVERTVRGVQTEREEGEGDGVDEGEEAVDIVGRDDGSREGSGKEGAVVGRLKDGNHVMMRRAR